MSLKPTINPFSSEPDMVRERNSAANIDTDTSNFDNNLTAADDTVQKALDKLDNIILSKSVTIPNPTASEDITLWPVPSAITVVSVKGYLTGATNVGGIELKHDTDRSAAGNDVFAAARTVSSTTSGDTLTLGGDITVPANSVLWVETGSLSGTPDSLSLTIQYTED